MEDDADGLGTARGKRDPSSHALFFILFFRNMRWPSWWQRPFSFPGDYSRKQWPKGGKEKKEGLTGRSLRLALWGQTHFHRPYLSLPLQPSSLFRRWEPQE